MQLERGNSKETRLLQPPPAQGTQSAAFSAGCSCWGRNQWRWQPPGQQIGWKSSVNLPELTESQLQLHGSFTACGNASCLRLRVAASAALR